MDKKRILIVEDESSLSNALRDKLVKEGFDVEVAVNGQEGIEAINRAIPDVILLDVVMPVMDGMSMLQNLKNGEKTKDIPVIVLSNLGDSKDILKAMENEAYDYLIKSDVTLDAILERIKTKLGIV